MGEYERDFDRGDERVCRAAHRRAICAHSTIGCVRWALQRPMLLIQSNGGAVSVEQVAERPVTLLLSGPAAGVGALRYYARRDRLATT